MEGREHLILERKPVIWQGFYRKLHEKERTCTGAFLAHLLDPNLANNTLALSPVEVALPSEKSWIRHWHVNIFYS